MSNPTSSFGWQMPTASDLVTDLPADFETFGQAVDTTLADLKGGTTGQVLSKASNTDMDFTWVAQDDSNAIQNAIVDAKGDLIAASAADTPARLAVGNNGETLVADSSTSTGLRYQGNFAAGKNKIINGDFGIWQRGTSFTPVADTGIFTADRFIFQRNGSGYTATCSRQTFTPGTAPVAGYEGQFFWRYAVTTAGTSNTYAVLDQRIENVQTLAGQTATISFWAKADAARTVTLDVTQEFGSGGSGQVGVSGGSHSVTTSWTRFTATVSVPSISGKTVGTGSYLIIRFGFPTGVTETIDIWGLQVEAGSVATAFQTATGTIQGELGACQRYYVRMGASNGATASSYSNYGSGYSIDASNITAFSALPVQMRVIPTSVEYANLAIQDFAAAVIAVSSIVLNTSQCSTTVGTVNGGVSGSTAARGNKLLNNNNTAGYLAFSAEL